VCVCVYVCMCVSNMHGGKSITRKSLNFCKGGDAGPGYDPMVLWPCMGPDMGNEVAPMALGGRALAAAAPVKARDFIRRVKGTSLERRQEPSACGS
jgi:hypothetical protein